MRGSLNRPILVAFSAVLAVLLLMFVGPAPIQAQTGRVTGTVRDSLTGQPVGGAEVVLVGANRRAATAEDGTYAVGNVPPGTYTLEVRRVGYAAARRTGLAVAAGRTATLDVRLIEIVSRLQEIVITGVQVSGDLRHARVLFTGSGRQGGVEDALAGLRSAAGFLRGQLGRTLHLRYAPELVFEADDSVERSLHVAALLKQVMPRQGDTDDE